MARNTVRWALAAHEPPKYTRAAAGSSVDAFEDRIRRLLVEFPDMPATVIAERVGWTGASSVLRARVALLRLAVRGTDPADRTTYAAGEVVQCDLWFPERVVPDGAGRMVAPPVLTLIAGYSRFVMALMLPSRTSGDLLAGMWSLLGSSLQAVPKMLVWDNEAGIGQHKRLTVGARSFAGTMGLRIYQTAARDPEAKGMVERANGFLQTSFMPGRSFTGGPDFNTQLTAWLPKANTRLARSTPLLPGAQTVTYVDIDDTIRQTHGYAKQGVGYGYSGVKGLNASIATVSTPLAAPVIAATRLRRGSANSARGAARLVAHALITARAAGAGGPDSDGLVLLRADSAFYGHDTIATARRHGARFSVTARMTATVQAAISRIPDTAWTPIRYPDAVWDEEGQCWISDAEVAETPFTAFTSRRKAEHISARLVVRRVTRLNLRNTQRGSSSSGSGESVGQAVEQAVLFETYRYHAFFTDSTLPLLQADTTHRKHAIVEQVIVRFPPDLKNGPLAHLPSGKFDANAAWLVLAAIAFNLTRAAGCLASVLHARATTGTLRAQLINLPARLARSGRRLVLHLPEHWPWQDGFQQLFSAATCPPTAPGTRS